MVIRIYNDTIIAPAKCGTRYLNKIWKYTEFKHMQYLRFPKVKYIVLRKPLSHLITAIHTETIEFINEFDNKFGKIDYSYTNLLNKFTRPTGTTHWCFNFYEYLYYYRNKYGNDIQIVKLENLTELLKNLGYNNEYTPEEYNFNDYKTWMPKEELFQMLTDMYLNEINSLFDKIEIQNIYYNKLINNEIDINQQGKKIML
jgi:hypothetical protein